MGNRDLVDRWPKVCATCSNTWVELTWRDLPLICEASLDVSARIEVRRCTCGETLAIATANNPRF